MLARESGRRITVWIMTHPDRLDPDDKARLEQILARRPELADAAELVRGFATMTNQPTPRALRRRFVYAL